MNNENIIVEFDPDFDAPTTASERDLFEVLGGTRAFWAGFIVSLLSIMSLGFVILATELLRGKTISL